MALREELAGHAGTLIGTLFRAAAVLLAKVVPDLRAADLPLQAIKLGCADLGGQASALLALVLAGKITPDTGAQLLGALGQVGAIREVHELEQRLQALEAAAQV